MPQSLDARASELSNLPEHTAAAAAAQRGNPAHPTAHELTSRAEDHSRNSVESSRLVHGQAAALLARRKKQQRLGTADPAKLATGSRVLGFAIGSLCLGIAILAMRHD